jgi:hypothetical protein
MRRINNLCLSNCMDKNKTGIYLITIKQYFCRRNIKYASTYNYKKKLSNKVWSKYNIKIISKKSLNYLYKYLLDNTKYDNSYC